MAEYTTKRSYARKLWLVPRWWRRWPPPRLLQLRERARCWLVGHDWSEWHCDDYESLVPPPRMDLLPWSATQSEHMWRITQQFAKHTVVRSGYGKDVLAAVQAAWKAGDELRGEAIDEQLELGNYPLTTRPARDDDEYVSRGCKRDCGCTESRRLNA